MAERNLQEERDMLRLRIVDINRRGIATCEEPFPIALVNSSADEFCCVLERRATTETKLAAQASSPTARPKPERQSDAAESFR